MRLLRLYNDREPGSNLFSLAELQPVILNGVKELRAVKTKFDL